MDVFERAFREIATPATMECNKVYIVLSKQYAEGHLGESHEAGNHKNRETDEAEHPTLAPNLAEAMLHANELAKQSGFLSF